MHIFFRTTLFTATTIISAIAFAESTQKTAGQEKIVVQKSLISVTVAKGFHLNKEAPAQLKNEADKSEIAPILKQESRFDFKTPKNPGRGTLEFYVCDDAKTVCEPHSHEVSWGEKKSSARIDESSWLKNFDDALAKAQSEKKLVLIDFATRWCPACIRLETETFNQTLFQKVRKNYVLVHLDGDLESSHELMNNYNVKAYPTLIVTDPKGKELYRTLDFQEAAPLTDTLLKFAKQSAEPLSISKLPLGNISPADSVRLGDQFANALDNENAIFWYEKSLGTRYQQTRIDFWDEKASDNPKDKSLSLRHQEALETAIRQWPESFPSIDWRLSLAKLVGETTPAGKKSLEQVVNLCERWANEKALAKAAEANTQLGEVVGFDGPHVYYLKSQALKSLNKSDIARDAQLMAVNEMLKLKPDESKPLQMFYLATYLKDLNRLPEIEKIYTDLQARYPTEFIYPERHSRILLDNHLPDQALPLATKAFELAEGNRKFVIGLLIAKIRVEQKKKTEARNFIKELLASPLSSSPRNASIVKRINEYAKEL